MAVIFSYIAADVAVAVVTCLVGIYLYYDHVFRYWKRRGVHYMQPTLFFGNFKDVVAQKKNQGEFLKDIYDSNPNQKVVGFYAFREPMLMVRDLDLVRSIMVKDAQAFLDRPVGSSQVRRDQLFSRTLFALTGKRWRPMRAKLTPTFTSGKIKQMFYLVNECGKQLLLCIDQEMTQGKCVVKDAVARYSTDVIATCAFGLNANALADPNSEFRATTRKMFEQTKLRKLIGLLSIFAPWLLRLAPDNIHDRNVDNYIRKIFWEVADYRKKNKIVRKDFVDILMQMKEKGEVQPEDANDLQEIKQDSKHTESNHISTENKEIELESDDFVAQAFIFIAAGFETSSSVITFTLYELARNPAIQDRLRKEMLSVLDKHNSEVTYDAITEMSYLEMVVSEAMRKYPTLPLLIRKCLQDYKISGTDITIEKGTVIMIPLLAIHNDPAIYPEPEKFDPERFSPENKSKRSNFAHMPFGEGPRICIGMRFGQVQVKTALVHILTTFKVKQCADTPLPPLGVKPGPPVNMPRKDIVLAFEKIK